MLVDNEYIKSNIKLDSNDCWIWQKCIGLNGYGQIRRKGKTYTMHRLAYGVYNGQFDKEMHVLHKCDNRACINPEHLFLGSNQENIIDSVNKNRRKGITRKRPRGLQYQPMSLEGRENHKKLNLNIRIKIKKLYESGKTQIELCKVFGITRTTIWRYLKEC